MILLKLSTLDRAVNEEQINRKLSSLMDGFVGHPMMSMDEFLLQESHDAVRQYYDRMSAKNATLVAGYCEEVPAWNGAETMRMFPGLKDIGDRAWKVMQACGVKRLPEEQSRILNISQNAERCHQGGAHGKHQVIHCFTPTGVPFHTQRLRRVLGFEGCVYMGSATRIAMVTGATRPQSMQSCLSSLTNYLHILQAMLSKRTAAAQHC